MQAEAQSLKCDVLALNGVEDHVHSLLCLPTTVTIAEVVKQMKGVSSLFANAEFGLPFDFKWSACYAAFSISRWDKTTLIAYIENQKRHHSDGTSRLDLELPAESELHFHE